MQCFDSPDESPKMKLRGLDMKGVINCSVAFPPSCIRVTRKLHTNIYLHSTLIHSTLIDTGQSTKHMTTGIQHNDSFFTPSQLHVDVYSIPKTF